MNLEININERLINLEGRIKIRSALPTYNIHNYTFIENLLFIIYFDKTEEENYKYGLCAAPISSINISAPPTLYIIFTDETGVDNRESKNSIFKKLKAGIDNFDFESLKNAIYLAKKIIKSLEK